MHTRLSKFVVLLLLSAVMIGLVFTACSDDDNPVSSVDKKITVLFLSDRTGVDKVYGMNATGTFQIPMVSDSSTYKEPVWSPDGTRFAVVGDGEGYRRLWIVNVDSLTMIDPVVTLGELQNPVWSPDGSRIAVATSSAGIVIAETGGSNLPPIMNYTAGQFPAWHPDGSKISCAYYNAATTSWETRWLTTDGSFTTTKIYTTICGGMSGWSPDGTSYFRCGRSGSRHVLMIEENGSDVASLYCPEEIDCPTWLPDGSVILLSIPLISPGPYDVLLWGRGLIWEVLTSDAGNNTQPDCDEAMSKIVFCSDRDGNEEIYRMNFDGTNQVNLSKNAARDWGPKIRPGQ